MKCSQCQTANRRGARFCRQCNAGLGVACGSCGKISLIGSRFCDACGAALAAIGAEFPVHPVAVSARRALEGENKQVTVFFCDIVNSTALTESLGPEATHALLDRFFDIVVPEINRFEGSVNQFLGDGFMALYGAPVAHEDHARRAVLAALAIRQKISAGIEIADGRRVEVVMRIGLNTGFVVVGRIGENLRMDYTAIGDTTVVAARLQQTAQPGDIQISESTRRAVGNLVELDSAVDLQLKGKSHLVTAWRVLGLRRRGRGEAIGQRALAPFVGRDRELTSLQDALLDVEDGNGRLIGLVGEPGIGKTRLLHEFTHGIDPLRVECVEGGCSPYGTATAYMLVLELLRGACDIDETDASDVIEDKIAATLVAVGLDPKTDSAPLMQILDTAATAEAPSPTAAEALKSRLFGVVTQLVLRRSRRRPLLLVLENLHWIDAASSELLSVLAERLVGAPVLVVATYRPGYTPPWSGKSYASQIALRPLSAAQCQALIEPLLHDHREMIAGSLVAKAEGNPFFLEELARNALEHLGDGGTDTVPDSVHGVITARIDRVSATAKKTLQAAAVLGREFAKETLQQILERSVVLGDALNELVRAEFLYERVTLIGTDYVFRHALMQDVAYGTLLHGQRAHYHAAAGAAILGANRDRPAAVAERLAYHFSLSDRDDDAVKYGLLAAEAAQRRWANDAALSFFKSAARRLEAMPDSAANRLLRIDAVIGQAEVMFALGQQAEHVQALEAIRPLVEDCADDKRRASWSYWTGFLHSFTGSRPEVSIGYCRDAARIASEAGLEELQAYSNCCLAHVSVLAGDLANAMSAGERALPIFESAGNTHWACRTLWGMSMAANAIGDWSRGLDICKRALDHGNAAENNRLTVVGWMRTGSTLIFQGYPRDGIACCETALSLSPSPYDARMIRSILAYGRLRAGEAEVAVEELGEATAWFEQSRLQYTWTYFSLWLTEGYLRLDKGDLALALARRALTAAETYGYRHLEGLAHRMIGESLASMDGPQSKQHLESAVQLLAAVGARNDAAKARVLLARRSSDKLHGLLAEALHDFEALGTVDEIARTRALIDQAGVD
jgi:class 3 adenylate cyclase/tetratricopeptide (TPR) repeat protein